MPGIRVTEKQAKVLEAIGENRYADRRLILKYTGLRTRIGNKILQSLLRKGLISKTTKAGSVFYSKTDLEYILPDNFAEETKILQFLRESRGTTRNKISVNLGFNWKKTTKLLSSLEDKGLVKKIDYNGMMIYVHA